MGENFSGVSDFGIAAAQRAGEVHERLLERGADLNLSKPRPVDFYLGRLAEMKLISGSQAESLAEMIGMLHDQSKEIDRERIAELRRLIAEERTESHVAIAIAGVVEVSASGATTPFLRSIAGSDAFGAVLGGVGGAIAGEMVGGPVGAVFGGCFGAVLIGGLASAQAA